MRLIIYTLCLLTIFAGIFSATGINAILDTMNHKPIKDIFKAFHYLHKKSNQYQLNSMEGLKRYKIFKANLKWTKEQNQKLGKQIYGITKFADLTKEEFKEKYLLKPENFKASKNPIKKSTEIFSVTSLFLQDEFEDDDDLKIMNYKNSLRLLKQKDVKRDTETFQHKMPEIKDQQENHSSWAFAAISTIESRYYNNSNAKKFLNFSEQHLIDCVNSNNNKEEIFTNTFNWIIDNGVIESKNFNKENKKEICAKNNSHNKFEYKIVDKFSTFNNENGDQNNVDWYKLLKDGPIVAAIDAQFDGFMLYRPDKFDAIFPDKCGDVNHAVVVIGKTIENKKEYLIVRNSFGKDWGFEGNFKIPSEMACGILTYAYRPNINIIDAQIPESKE